MLKVGLTGGIGSGKSMVANFLAEFGAYVIDTDLIAHELTAANGQAMAAIQEFFGTTVVAPDGSLDRSAMRNLVFNNAQARAQLESILHPLIFQQALNNALQATGPYVVFVVPLLVESGRWLNRVDQVCVVDCEPETQIERVKARSGLTTEAIERIMYVQATREQRLAVADHVLFNGAQTTVSMLKQQALQLHTKFLSH